MLRPRLNRVWATSNSQLRRDPGDAKYIQGWISEIPTYQVLNYLQYKVDTTLLALAERGVFEWGSDIQYGINSLVWDDATKTIYVAAVGNPDRAKRPSQNLEQWTASSIQVSRASYDAVVEAINAHIADVTGNPHKLTAGRLNAYNKNETDAIVNQYYALVRTHVDDKGNPHKVTATQVGAVPVGGGTYSGNVTFLAGIKFNASGAARFEALDTGLWMRNGTSALGIHIDGRVMAGPGSNPSEVITTQSFADWKAQQEPNYAVPVPVFEMALSSDISIQKGPGTANFSWDPAFVNGALEVLNPPVINNNDVIRGSKAIWHGSPDFTISVDLKALSPRNGDGDKSLLFGLSHAYIFVSGQGYVFAEDETRTMISKLPTKPVGQWNRVTAVFQDKYTTLYIDGVAVASSVSTTSRPADTWVALSIVYGKSEENRRSYQARNFRIWNEALTPKQVSAL